MRIKLVFVFVMLSVLLTAMSDTPASFAACTGDVCGCNLDFAACMEDCVPAPDGDQCERGCNREYLNCSICCCESQHPRCQ
jgi:hypothetical protein